MLWKGIRRFSDSRIYLEAGVSGSTFYATGTDEVVMPGFDSPLGSKVQVVFDLPNSSDMRLAKECSYYIGTSTERTGFVYYNFPLGRWRSSVVRILRRETTYTSITPAKSLITAPHHVLG